MYNVIYTIQGDGSMDPIKVDFTGSGAEKGPDKKTGIVIPPEKKGLKIVINIILTAIFGGILSSSVQSPLFTVQSTMLPAVR